MLLKRKPAWDADNKAAILNLYRLAQMLTEKTGEPWHIDHELPLNGELVSGLHVLANLRVIRGQENLMKGAQFAPG
jgi:hypothetical protein